MIPSFYCIFGKQKPSQTGLCQASDGFKPSVSSSTNSNASSHRLSLQPCWLLLNSKWSGDFWMSSPVLKNNHLLLGFLILGIRRKPSPLSCDPPRVGTSDHLCWQNHTCTTWSRSLLLRSFSALLKDALSNANWIILLSLCPIFYIDQNHISSKSWDTLDNYFLQHIQSFDEY